MDSPRRQFVLLEHAWDGIHWDFMLESSGTLRTWSLRDRPIPDRRIEAEALANHRLVYLNYEGPISHQRGLVRRLDRGNYEPIIWDQARVLVNIWGNQVIGVVDLRRLGGSDCRYWSFRWGKAI